MRRLLEEVHCVVCIQHAVECVGLTTLQQGNILRAHRLLLLGKIGQLERRFVSVLTTSIVFILLLFVLFLCDWVPHALNQVLAWASWWFNTHIGHIIYHRRFTDPSLVFILEELFAESFNLTHTKLANLVDWLVGGVASSIACAEAHLLQVDLRVLHFIIVAKDGELVLLVMQILITRGVEFAEYPFYNRLIGDWV